MTEAESLAVMCACLVSIAWGVAVIYLTRRAVKVLKDDEHATSRRD